MNAFAYQFTPAERPALPGSPYTPTHPLWRRFVYVGVAFMSATTATLGNALVSTNGASIAGSIGEYAAAVAVLPALFVAMNATGNLTIVKARIEWGIPVITGGALSLYAFVAFLQLIFPNFALALCVRATSGLCASALITVTTYYLFQVFPPKLRPAALVAGLGLTQIGIPLARLFPVEALAQHRWQNLHLIELALPLAMLAVMKLFPLPPTDRSKAFEPVDFLTIAMIVPAMVLICVVLSTGRVYWWTDTPWLGWMLAAAVPLLTIAVLVETNRERPLLYMQWISSGVILRFAGAALFLRIALAEQTFGSVGLLGADGLNNEQLRTLFVIVFCAMLIGIATAVLTLNPKWLRQQGIAAALCIGLGAWLDSQGTNLTRPHELYLSQALLGFGATLFIGPTMAFGFGQMMRRGASYFVTLVVLFSTTQNVGSLVGSAILGTYQTAATRAHALALAEHLTVADPQVVDRIQTGARLLGGSALDPRSQFLQGSALLAQAQAREATVLAFNDVFGFVALLALGTASFVLYFVLRDLWREHRRVARVVA